mmetsp:Transcript_13410/g.31577  ORF Transcript_13410/g.31577 Transcript_13410/m.31577 type:complete len:93 (-) Transcript_13410:1066-1344(-)
MLPSVALLSLGFSVLLSWSFVTATSSTSPDPILLRAARGDSVERTPVWMMRQAGRHMQAYRDLLKDYPTFRERSETPHVSRDVSLQPLKRCM